MRATTVRSTTSSERVGRPVPDRRGQGDGWIGADSPAGDRGRVPHWSQPGHPTANALRYMLIDVLCCRAAQRGWRSAHQLIKDQHMHRSPRGRDVL